MSKTINQNLFRFVTLRNPQLIDKKEEKPGFVFHPDEKSGAYFKAISGLKEKDIPGKLQETSDTFSAAKTRSDVRLIDEGLYIFSSWLMKNKNALTFAEIKTKLGSVEPLSLEKELNVWDNLIYQTVAKTSVYVREALIQLLVANKFALAFQKFSSGLGGDVIFTEDQEKEFIRRANASVVLSKALRLQKPASKKSTPLADNKLEQRLNDLIASKYELCVIGKLEEELRALKKSYDVAESTKYESALKSHQESVDLIMAKATIGLVDQWNADKQVYEQVEQLKHDKLPEFTYEKSTEIDSLSIQAKVSALSFQYLTDQNLLQNDTFQKVLDELKTKASNKESEVQALQQKSSKTVLKGGSKVVVKDPIQRFISKFDDLDKEVEFYVDNEISLDHVPAIVNAKINAQDTSSNCYTVVLKASATRVDSDDDRDWYFTMDLSYESDPVTVTGMNYNLVYTNDDITINSTDYQFSSTGPKTLTTKLFDDRTRIERESNAGAPRLSGTITLSNGETLNFDEVIGMSSTGLGGLIGQKQVDFSCEDDTTDPPTTDSTIYGVTNLGIADFRRVEQEVCCYVPGEVSHIENILAREYKERSTRSLLSSETTTERTDTTERENLTDTTTTERNEMQSEVAQVLNEDQAQSYGGNASVHGGGKNWGFNAGAYFDSSSSSSTSNSNSQAQTYAQEVTERAMERIVTKVESKRTSRILKEFEENNKHGFDNTEGTEHVTGVYRWVDKIYKNKLINYGKRLMYEFAIPEPARFLKDAIWKQIENNEIESDVIIPEPPIHPKNNGILSAQSLTRSNYKSKAALYGAEVSEPQPIQIFTGKSMSYIGSPGGGEYNENTSEATDLEIPEGYYTVSAKASWFDSLDNHINNSVVFVGNRQMPNNSIIETPINKFVNTIPVSCSQLGNLSGSINVSVKLNLLPEAFEKWQNETYTNIMDAYYERLREYNDAIVANEGNLIQGEDAERLSFNPLLNRSLEKKELKRIAIQLLAEPYSVETARNNYSNGELKSVNRNEAFQRHASAVKFFEQAFDWDIMAYIFYPYMYASESDWKTLFQEQEAADPIFQAFLQSGMARTTVPVRPGFEDAVNWYMETGEIWNGQGLVADQDNDLYVSIAEEMQTVEGEVEGTWETRLPTSLTIVQAKSALLEEDGLPCFCEEEQSDNTIKPSTTILIGDSGAPA